jgi:hypothetical protein
VLSLTPKQHLGKMHFHLATAMIRHRGGVFIARLGGCGIWVAALVDLGGGGRRGCGGQCGGRSLRGCARLRLACGGQPCGASRPSRVSSLAGDTEWLWLLTNSGERVSRGCVLNNGCSTLQFFECQAADLVHGDFLDLATDKFWSSS